MISVLSQEKLKEYISLRRARKISDTETDKNNYYPSLVKIPGNTFDPAMVAYDPTPSYADDPHSVSWGDAHSYYGGLPSKPRLLYRTGKQQWFVPEVSPEGWRSRKQLIEVFGHPITDLWNDVLAWKVVDILDAHTMRFTSIDVVRLERVLSGYFKGEDGTQKSEQRNTGLVTIWIGVFPESTTPTDAHNAAEDILALLKEYEITDVDIEFRESFYTRLTGPELLPPRPIEVFQDPLASASVTAPLTSTLGVCISTRASPSYQGTMALYLAEGGSSNRLLGLSCRHVLIGAREANIDYEYHPSKKPTKDVLLLGGTRAYADLVDSVKIRIANHGERAEYYTSKIQLESEKAADVGNVQEHTQHQSGLQDRLKKEQAVVEELAVFLEQVQTNWANINRRVLGYVLRSPAIALGVGEHRYTEDWGIFELDRDKLGAGFIGNAIDLGVTDIESAIKFSKKCITRGENNWAFQYPYDDGPLPLKGILTEELLKDPDMWKPDGDPCSLVVKNGLATGTTIGRANGVFSVVREYFHADMTLHRTSMEWAILNYEGEKAAFSEPGDSGSIIADIRGRIGGLLTGGSGRSKSSDVTYATPFWWLLQRIRANGFPDAHLDVVD